MYMSLIGRGAVLSACRMQNLVVASFWRELTDAGVCYKQFNTLGGINSAINGACVQSSLIPTQSCAQPHN